MQEVFAAAEAFAGHLLPQAAGRAIDQVHKAQEQFSKGNLAAAIAHIENVISIAGREVVARDASSGTDMLFMWLLAHARFTCAVVLTHEKAWMYAIKIKPPKVKDAETTVGSSHAWHERHPVDVHKTFGDVEFVYRTPDNGFVEVRRDVPGHTDFGHDATGYHFVPDATIGAGIDILNLELFSVTFTCTFRAEDARGHVQHNERKATVFTPL